jgi:nitrogenase iron protein
VRSIAFYGKGGIGKSTTISNVIAALSMMNKKILQIGCDPKHDSARLLLGGFNQVTVLEQLNTMGEVSLDTVMLTGFNTVKCIESGGPEPGVGCAGRGIIQTLQLLKDQGLDTQQFDYVFFDVLGDVVCGGFAVPMRDGYADEVYIVTSGEIASIYVANNIAKGLQRFISNNGKLGGIIGNLRGINNERQILEAFAKKIGTQIIAFIPRSELLPQAELASKTIMEFAPNTELANIYLAIANYIEQHYTPVIPTPLSEIDLEEFIQEFCYDTKIKTKTLQPSPSPVNNNSKQIAIQNIATCKNNAVSRQKTQVVVQKKRPPLYGCSLTGVYNVISQLKDAIALMYSPQGCAYINYCTHQSRFATADTPHFPNLLCINMRETDVIFGGIASLEKNLDYLKKRFPKQPIFLITSCPVGLIGDDVNFLVSKVNTKEQRIIHITSDGVIGGDFYSGLIAAYKVVAEEFIDKTVRPTNDTINIIGEQSLSTTADPNFKKVSKILAALGIKINCRYIEQTSIAEIKNFKKANFNLPLIHGHAVHELSMFLDKYFGTETLQVPLPIGFEQTAEFTRVVACRFGKEDLAEAVIREAKIIYEKDVAQLKPFFAGKKALINSGGVNIDWLYLALEDVGVEVKQCNTFNIFTSDGEIPFKSEKIFSDNSMEEAVRLYHPDFILSSHSLLTTDIPCDFFPVLPLYGFNSGLDYVKKLSFKLRIPFTEGWKHDE